MIIRSIKNLYFFPFCLCLATSLVRLVLAQTFDGILPCPNDSSINGYTSIADLNVDMQRELERISALSEVDRLALTYQLILCPGETFDIATQGPIVPVLNDVLISCGDPRSSANNICLISGGASQVRVVDSTIPGYQLTNMVIDGMTFEGFTSFSIEFTANRPAELTISNSMWQNFEAEYVVAAYDVRRPGTVEITDSIIQRGVASEGIFFNIAGLIMIDNVMVRESRTGVLSFTASAGLTMMKNTMIASSEVDLVVHTLDDSTTMIENVNIARNDFIGAGIITEGNNAVTNINGVTIGENKNTIDSIPFPWTAFSTFAGGELLVKDSTIWGNENIQFIFYTAEGATRLVGTQIIGNANYASDEFIGFLVAAGGRVEVLDSVLQDNEQLSYGFRIDADSPANYINIKDSDFFGNSANPSTPSSSLIHASSGMADLQGIKFDGNLNFMSSIAGTGGAFIDFHEVCWLGGNNGDVILVFFGQGADEGSFRASDNHVAPTEATEMCQESGMRVGVTDATGQLTCGPGADQVDMCMAPQGPTPQPTPPPARPPAPSPTPRPPSGLPPYLNRPQTRPPMSKGKGGTGGSKSSKKTSKKSSSSSSSSSKIWSGGAGKGYGKGYGKGGRIVDWSGNGGVQNDVNNEPLELITMAPRPYRKPKTKLAQRNKQPLRTFQSVSSRVYAVLKNNAEDHETERQ